MFGKSLLTLKPILACDSRCTNDTYAYIFKIFKSPLYPEITQLSYIQMCQQPKSILRSKLLSRDKSATVFDNTHFHVKQ